VRPTKFASQLLVALTLGCTGLAAAPAHAAADAPGSQQWATRYSGPAGANDKPVAMVVSPDGTTVFVTGYSIGVGTGSDFATIAYDRSTGAQLWVARYDGQGRPYDDDNPTGIAVSPDGGTVYVTGPSDDASTSNYATVAYDAANGTQKWVARESFGSGRPSGVAVSPDGSTVFVTGTGGIDFFLYDITIAYDSATGTQQWQSNYTNFNVLFSTGLAISPDGSRLFVVGTQQGSGSDVTILAYDTSDGTQEWLATYVSPAGDVSSAFALSPDGTRLFVAGYTGPLGTGHGLDALTIAFDSSSGAQLWSSTFNGRTGHDDYATGIAVNPAGTKVYVTGTTDQFESRSSFLTMSFDASNGETLRLARYDGPVEGRDVATGIAMSPLGAFVYVTGWSPGIGSALDFATIAYTARNLRQVWVSRYDGPGHHEDQAVVIDVTPDGRAVEVTGSSDLGGDAADIETVSYRA
jgi:DNA-binding beta-propeller fold protein YncE